MRAMILVLVLLSVTASLAAQGEPPITKAERVYSDIRTVSEVAGVEDGDESGKKPDYSKEALLSVMWTDPYHDEDVPRAPKTFNPLEFTILGQTFRFMPFLGSMSGPTSATPFEYVDPFAVAPVSAAYTPRTFRDRWWEWKMRRKLGKDE